MNGEGRDGASTSSAPPQRSQTGSRQTVIRPPTVPPSSSGARDDRAIDGGRPIFAKKSSASRNVSPPPTQPRGPIPRAKGSRQVPHSKSASSVRISIKSVPLSSRRVENDTGPSRLSDPQVSKRLCSCVMEALESEILLGSVVAHPISLSLDQEHHCPYHHPRLPTG